MTRRWMSVVAASVLLAVAGHAVQAEEAKEQPKAEAKQDNVFADKFYAMDVTKQKKTYACFVREYDSTHLAKHPKQKVSAMKLLVTAEQVPEDENLDHSFSLGVKFRNRSGNFASAGSCGHAKASESENGKEHLRCSVDCDGGGIDVELAADAKAILANLDTIRIWNIKKPNDENTVSLNGGADDRAFRLDRAPLEMCKSLVTDRDELAAMRAQANRQKHAAK